MALEIMELQEFLQREEPTVIMVRADASFPLNHRLKDGFSNNVYNGVGWHLRVQKSWADRLKRSSPINHRWTEGC